MLINGYGDTVKEPDFCKEVIDAKCGVHNHWCPKNITTHHGVRLWKNIIELWK